MPPFGLTSLLTTYTLYLDANTLLNHLILHHLIVEGHVHAVELFARELGVDLSGYLTPPSNIEVDLLPRIRYSDVQIPDPPVLYDAIFAEAPGPQLWLDDNPRLEFALRTVHQRNAIRENVVRGDIPKALQLLTQWFPRLLDLLEELHFELLRMNVVEMIRTHTAGNDSQEQEFLGEVLGYVQEHMLEMVQHLDHLFSKLELTMALLCFGEAGSRPEPLERLFDVLVRDTLACDVNQAVLALCGDGVVGRLEGVVKLHEWSEVKVRESGIVKD